MVFHLQIENHGVGKNRKIPAHNQHKVNNVPMKFLPRENARNECECELIVKIVKMRTQSHNYNCKLSFPSHCTTQVGYILYIFKFTVKKEKKIYTMNFP